MWRLLRLVIPNSKAYTKFSGRQKLFSTSTLSKNRKLLFGIIASTGLGFSGAIIYSDYEPKFKNFLEAKIPQIKHIYKVFPDISIASVTQKDDSAETRIKHLEKIVLLIENKINLLKEKLNRKKVTTSPKSPTEQTQSNSNSTGQSKDDKYDESNAENIKPLDSEDIISSRETTLNETILKLKEIFKETTSACRYAANSIKLYNKNLYEALQLSDDNDDFLWKEIDDSRLEKEKALNLAKEKTTATRMVIENLKTECKKLLNFDADNSLVKNAEDLALKYSLELQKFEEELLATETEAKTVLEYEHLLKTSKEQFSKELQIILPNYVQDGKDSTVTEHDLNLLIIHAHRKIGQLQKQVAKQQATEKLRIDEAVRNQKMQDELLTESKMQMEMLRYRLDLDNAVENRITSLKSNFEAELHQQLLQQITIHADYLHEALKLQEEELKRKHALELEEKLLHQRNDFVFETCSNIDRLKNIIKYLSSKIELDKSSKKIQALWLACQAMIYKVTLDTSECPSSLANHIELVKTTADEDNDFINSVLASIPSTAVTRGVFSNETLKQRFRKVKQVCKKVALIDENNDSLYMYFLSYLQSILRIEAESRPEDDGNVAADTSEWDTFDVLQKITYCLKVNDLEQALRYANQLKGEPRIVASDWMNELELLLETQLAAKALLAYAAAVAVQTYH